MAFDAVTPFNKIVDLLEGVTGIQSVVQGIPESYSHQVTASVSAGGHTIVDQYAGGTLRREIRFFVQFGYLVAGAEAAVEMALIAALDEFETEFYAARLDVALSPPGTTLAELDLSLADQPEYAITAGQEYRTYPMLVRVWQDHFNG